MKNISLFCILALYPILNPAQSQDLQQHDEIDDWEEFDGWEYITKSASGTKVYYHLTTMRTNGPIRTVWVKSDHSKDVTVKHRESMIRYHINCDSRSTTLLELTEYNAKGSPSYSYKIPLRDQDADDVIPESIGESIVDSVCEWGDVE